jgi:hypothetical protein
MAPFRPIYQIHGSATDTGKFKAELRQPADMIKFLRPPLKTLGLPVHLHVYILETQFLRNARTQYQKPGHGCKSNSI